MMCRKTFSRSSLCIFMMLGILSLSGMIAGQATGDPKEDFLYGEYYLAGGQYENAIPFYLSALQDDPENSNINYRIGQCYLKSLGVQRDAVPYLEKAVRNIDSHYIEGRFKDRNAPPEAWLLLGDAYHRDNQLMKASYAYHEYKRLISGSDKEKMELVISRIAGLGIASEFQREEDKICLNNLGGMINSRFSDYNPVLSGDQKTLVYTQFWESFDRIMITEYENGNWSEPRDISSEIATEGQCYTSALSFDGKELYLIRHIDEKYDIYVSRTHDGRWGKMEPIGGRVNSSYRESSVSISADGNYLYFASDRPGGLGGFDLYRATKSGEGWTDIRNLGKTVNTVMNEEAPYISYDGTVLYFSSDGHMTIGNMDIVCSELDDENSWRQPVNLGSPINTTNDDIFYVYFKDTGLGYLSRDMEGGFGKNDIYMVQKRVNLVSENSGRPEPAQSSIPDAQQAEKYIPESSASGELDNPVPVVEVIDDAPGELQRQTNEITRDKQYEVYNETPGDESYPPETLDSIPTYTIQIFALHKPLKLKKITLAPLTVSQGEDGLFRYTYGEFVGWSKALELLEGIRNAGYPDAFIRNIDSVPNYKGNDNEKRSNRYESHAAGDGTR